MWVHEKRGLAMLFLSGFCLVAGMAGGLPPIEIPVCAKTPMLDGKLDDPAWRQATRIEHLYLINSATPAPETTLYLARDEAWLYIGADCRNSNMSHVMQLSHEHNQPVWQDDSLELLLRPTSDENAVYYHLALNFANVGRAQRCDKAGLRDLAWSPHWRTVTQRRADGWTAEIAVPWCCLNTDDLSKMSVNIGRNLIQVELDPYGAKQGETRVHGMLVANNQKGYHNIANFVEVSGLAGFKPSVPFAPRIKAAEIIGMRQAEDKNAYELMLALDLSTSVGGTARVKIMEDFGAGEVEAFVQTVDIKGAMTHALQVPSDGFRQRKVRVVLSDLENGNLLAACVIGDTSALNIIRNAFVGRSYYTSEENAAIHVELGLPENMLAEGVMTIEVGGKRVLDLTGLQPVMTPAVPVAALSLGDNSVQLRVLLNGKELAAEKLNVMRLEPRSGYETKSDFIKGMLLKDGQPFFAIGICGHTLQQRLGLRDCNENDEAVFRFLAEDIGLNTIVRMRSATNLPAFMQLAEKHGLHVVNWSYPGDAVSPMHMLRERLKSRINFATLDLPENLKHSLESDKQIWSGVNGSLSLPDRLLLRRAIYEQLEPEAVADIELLHNYQNLIGYWNMDEPNLVNPDDRIAMAEWYGKTVRSRDPYRPLFLLYATHIPHGNNWTRWGDVLGYDVYPRPFMPGIFGDPGLYTLYYASQLRERCRRDNKIMWFVPLANMLDLGRTPIGMSRAHMLCQAYAAIISGARGLLYFSLPNVVGEDAWDALRTIAAQVREMTPALAHGDIAQNLKYTPDNLHPREQKFPMVNAAVFKYPEGGYLLMAVNIKPFAVETTFKVGGLQSAATLFDADGKKFSGGIFGGFLGGKGQLAVTGESFTEKIEPYGVRAYRLKLAGAPAPVEVAIDMTAVEAEAAPIMDITGIVRQVMLGKNHVPNPCFERQFNKGVPDFYRPLSVFSVDPFWGAKPSGSYVDHAVLWEGRPSLRMFRRPWAEGGFKIRGLQGSFYPPLLDKQSKMTFSLYARAEQAEAGLFVQVGRHYGVDPKFVKNATFKLSTEWKRYHFVFDLGSEKVANMGRREIVISPAEGLAVWINGLQVEVGEQPTEFQDDSIVVKKK